MPSCFQLFKKGESTPCSLAKVDEDICNNVLNAPVHSKFWGGDPSSDNSFNWFDTIGFNIATGKQLGSIELRNHFLDNEFWKEESHVFQKILNYLEDNYTSYAFYAVNS
jgi:hypothetical protein